MLFYDLRFSLLNRPVHGDALLVASFANTLAHSKLVNVCAHMINIFDSSFRSHWEIRLHDSLLEYVFYVL